MSVSSLVINESWGSNTVGKPGLGDRSRRQVSESSKTRIQNLKSRCKSLKLSSLIFMVFSCWPWKPKSYNLHLEVRARDTGFAMLALDPGSVVSRVCIWASRVKSLSQVSWRWRAAISLLDVVQGCCGQGQHPSRSSFGGAQCSDGCPGICTVEDGNSYHRLQGVRIGVLLVPCHRKAQNDKQVPRIWSNNTSWQSDLPGMFTAKCDLRSLSSSTPWTRLILPICVWVRILQRWRFLF